VAERDGENIDRDGVRRRRDSIDWWWSG